MSNHLYDVLNKKAPPPPPPTLDSQGNYFAERTMRLLFSAKEDVPGGMRCAPSARVYWPKPRACTWEETVGT
jgi:hypothetical protein